MSRVRKADVAIVGAGVIGLFCGYFLARRGLDVVVLERGLPGSGSSTRGGGGIRSQFSTATNVRLSILSEPYWSGFEDRFGIDIDRRQIGYLFLARNEDTLATLSEQVDLQHQFGVPSEILGGADVSIRWPSLAPLGVAGASFCGADGFVNQHRVMQGLAQGAFATGVRIESGVDVTGITSSDGRIHGLQTTGGLVLADVVIDCAGAWAPALAKTMGVDLPIRARRVQLLIGRPDPPLPADLPWLIDPIEQGHVRQDVDGRAQVGGFLGKDETVNPSAFDHDADPEWIASVLSRTATLFGIHIDQSTVVRSWAGLYPSTPDQHPIIDRTEEGLVVVAGFAGLGLMHSPAAGILAAELVIDGRISSLDARDVSLARFATSTESIEQTGF